MSWGLGIPAGGQEGLSKHWMLAGYFPRGFEEEEGPEALFNSLGGCAAPPARNTGTGAGGQLGSLLKKSLAGWPEAREPV